ncbi:GNAT family N-acetyltransferase [Streptomyces sp. NPDC059708]|uniref:GNAT family N-acetyltransferase n=1 Tax=Streptomyces sp. NPDC059708 TaxID=3346916 RepID=UPI00368D74D7
MSYFLNTDRLVLRAFRIADAERLFALHDDPEVMRFVDGTRHIGRWEIHTRTLPQFLYPFDHWEQQGYWAAHDRVTSGFLGWFEFRPVDEDVPAVARLGCRLHRAAWGQGYATEGARALIDRGFTGLGVERVTASTPAVHAAARRVLEKAGLSVVRHGTGDRPEAVERSGRGGGGGGVEGGEGDGDVEYELTRAGWERARRTPS